MTAPHPTVAPAIDLTVSRVVATDPRTAYDLVADVTRIGELSPEAYAATWLDGADRAVPGARFRGRNRLRFLRWSTVSTVIEAVPGEVFAFEVGGPSRSRWRWTFAAVDGGTLVTESVVKDDRLLLPIRVMQRLAGVTDRAEHLRRDMTATLGRVDAVLAASVVPSQS